MIEFLLMLAILAIGVLLFGKADSKREILQQVGLDLSETSYEAKKQAEFKKYCIMAIEKSLKDEDYYVTDELSFLCHARQFLNAALWGKRYRDGFTGEYCYTNPIYIGVKKHYIAFSKTVIERRLDDIDNIDKIKCTGNFADKSYVKKYIAVLWEKYQNPWPKDWLQKDGM